MSASLAARDAFRQVGPAWPSGPVGEVIAGARIGRGRVRLAAVVVVGSEGPGDGAAPWKFSLDVATEMGRSGCDLCFGVGVFLRHPEPAHGPPAARVRVRHAVLLSRSRPFGEIAVEHPASVIVAIGGRQSFTREVHGACRIDAVERAIGLLHDAAADSLLERHDLDVTLETVQGRSGHAGQSSLVGALAGPGSEVGLASERETALLGTFAGTGVVAGCGGADPREVAEMLLGAASDTAAHGRAS